MGGNALMQVLRDINTYPKRLQSNFCRVHAYEIGRLASTGLVTTANGAAFGYEWRCTYRGLRVLELGEKE